MGLDGVPRITRAIRFAAPARYADIDVALEGRWLDADSFEIAFDTIDTIDAGTLRFDFAGTSVTVTLFEKTYLRTNLSFTGTNDVASAE